MSNTLDATNDNERILSVRLGLASAWVEVLRYAYDALLHHGVNYRALPEYQDKSGLLDVALDKRNTLEQGQERILEYLKRLTSGITAAVRRKTMRQV